MFHGCFTLDAALAVGTAAPGEEAETIERIGSLVDKSFLAVQPRLGETAYRCLDTTRLYLQPKLEEAGESADVSQRHAQYYLGVFATAAPLWETAPVAEARTRLLPRSRQSPRRHRLEPRPGGRCRHRIALTLAGVPLWSALGLLDETRRRLEAAIAADRARGVPDPGQSMRLQAALGSCTVFLSGTVEAAWAETLRLAEGLGDTEHQLRALNGLALGAMRRDYAEAEQRKRFRDLAWRHGQPDDGPVGDRLLGYVLHMTGRQAEARQLTEAMLARYPRRSLQPHQNKLNMFDQRILSLGVLARIQWLQGEAAAALALCDAALAEARAMEHPFSQFFALSMMAAPIALLAGDLARARAAREEMTVGFRQTEGWLLWGEAYHALERISAGRSAEGAAALRAALAAMPDSAFSRTFPLFHAGLAQALLDVGRPDDALAAIEAALAPRGTATSCGSCPNSFGCAGLAGWRGDERRTRPPPRAISAMRSPWPKTRRQAPGGCAPRPASRACARVRRRARSAGCWPASPPRPTRPICGPRGPYWRAEQDHPSQGRDPGASLRGPTSAPAATKGSSHVSSELNGKVALVTGASRGIGRAAALALAGAGAAVAISYRAADAPAAEVVAQIARAGGRGRAYRADSARDDEVHRLLRSVVADFGGLDILVNNAAHFVTGAVDDPDTDEAGLAAQAAVNFGGVAAAIRAAAPLLRRGGRIITMGCAVAGHVGGRGLADYAATRAAVSASARALRATSGRSASR